MGWIEVGMGIGDGKVTEVEGEAVIVEELEAATCRVAVMHMEEEEARGGAIKATME